MKTVVIAGATGDLGGRIVRSLLSKSCSIRALVREGTPPAKRAELENVGIDVRPVSFANRRALAEACRGGSVVISSLSGLRDVIVDTQSLLLQAAVDAGVPRFIPSDFAVDYRPLAPGSNRNLELRREFNIIVDRAKIQATSILNGAFSDMLTGQAPFVLFKLRWIVCWGDPEQLMDWTTMNDTAEFTAMAALDDHAPRYLHIAGSEISARSLAETMTDLTGNHHRIMRFGTPGMLGAMAKLTKLLSPESKDLYPAWQGMQYMSNLYSGIVKSRKLDNARYPMQWTSVRDVLAAFLARDTSKSA